MVYINVALVDDHAVFLKGLEACLAHEPNLNVVITCRNGKELVESLPSLTVDLIIMDINMPVMDGIATTYKVRELFPGIKVLALSMYYEEKYILNMIQAGANGYLVKSSPPEEIIRAMNAIMQSNYYFNEHFSLAMIKAFQHAKGSDNESLTVMLNIREVEILKLVCEEFSNVEIAQKLYVSTRTVEGYRSKLIEKSGAKNLAGLVMFAVRRGIVRS